MNEQYKLIQTINERGNIGKELIKEIVFKNFTNHD
jgi:hypothetical protein